ncbi:MAG TPA: nucleotidyltransferase family protein [Alphaproteobacteria bacterium]|nr:nucleotidyltransferase family protein [Alphaproteobacteria bacterium]
MNAPRAMVLAAGYGLRLRPITATTPKPLVKVAGRTMLDRALDALAAAGVAEAVVNVHHLGAQIESHLAARARHGRRPATAITQESELLDTGGGITNALPCLGSDPFLAVNADIVWEDGPVPALRRLAEAFDPAHMDALLLMVACDRAVGFDGSGDFFMGEDGQLVRRGERATAPYVYAGLQMLTPTLFADAPAGPFSLNRLYDRAAERGRLFGIAHDGAWYHVGTPAALREADRLLGAAEVK